MVDLSLGVHTAPPGAHCEKEETEAQRTETLCLKLIELYEKEPTQTQENSSWRLDS